MGRSRGGGTDPGAAGSLALQVSTSRCSLPSSAVVRRTARDGLFREESEFFFSKRERERTNSVRAKLILKMCEKFLVRASIYVGSTRPSFLEVKKCTCV